MKKTLSLLAFLAVTGMSGASAQAATHYVSGFGGVSWMQNVDASDTYTTARDNYSVNYNLGSGLALTGAIGCDYGSTRLEAEVGYQTNDVVSAIDTNNGVAINYPLEGTSYGMRGDISVLSLMGNGYYDFDLGGKVELYATAGVGVAQVSLHDVNPVYLEAANGATVLLTDNNPGHNIHETTLAWQIGAGIAAPITDNVKLDLRYRYFATTDFTVSDWGWDSNSANANLSSHSVLLGLRVDF